MEKEQDKELSQLSHSHREESPLFPLTSHENVHWTSER